MKTLLSILLSACLVLSQDCGEICESEVDVVFVIDDSNTIADWQFEIMKEFITNVINDDIDIGMGQVGIIQFEDDSTVRCDLEDSLSAVEACLRRTVWEAGGLTNIEAGIVDAMNIRNQRRGFPKIMVIMTDGMQTPDLGDAVAAAREAKADGWEIFVIAMGNVDVREVEEMASDDDHVIFVDAVEDLENLQFSVCIAEDCPVADPCEEDCASVVDVVFVIDESNSVNDDDFGLMKEFIDLVATQSGVGDNALNIGVVTFDDQAETICDLENTMSDVTRCLDRARFDVGGSTNIPDGLTKAKEIRGLRSGIPKVIVLMTDGLSNLGGDPRVVADMAKDEGWLIYAIGIGETDFSFLRDLASEDEFVFEAGNFEDLLSTVAEDFQICAPGTGGSGGTVCSSEVDLIFLLDESNSINGFDYGLVKEFAKLVAESIQIGPDQGQVAVVSFDDPAVIRFNLNEHRDRESLNRAIDRVPFTVGGKTNIDDAFQKAMQVRGRRPGVPGVIVLATDGDPTRGDEQVGAAAEAKDQGFDVWVVAIGEVENLVRELASSPDQVIEVDDVGSLESVVGEIQVCEDIPCDVPCDLVCEARVDVCFILDESNSLASHHFNDMKTFVNAIVDDLTVGHSTAYVGIVTFDDDADTICDFQSSDGRARDCIADARHTDGGDTNIGAAIQACTRLQGGRRDVADVMVLMTDGNASPHLPDPVPIADDAKADGWTIFAIGIGAVDRRELDQIATSPDHVQLAESFEELLEEVLQTFALCLPAGDCEEEEVPALCGKSDIVWITDHSKSVAEWQLELLFEFQIAIVESTTVGRDFAMIGQVGFSDGGFTNFNLDTCSNSDCVVNQIRRISQEPGDTNLAAGIREGRNIRGGRRDVEKVFFLTTDGIPNRDQDQIESEARAAQRDGWTFICLAIGDFDLSYLEMFCDDIEIVDDFNALADKAQEIVCN